MRRLFALVVGTATLVALGTAEAQENAWPPGDGYVAPPGNAHVVVPMPRAVRRYYRRVYGVAPAGWYVQGGVQVTSPPPMPMPPPLPPPPPVVYPPPPAAVAVMVPPRPPREPRFGIGLRAMGGALGTLETLGFGGHLRYRTTPWLSVELAAEGQVSASEYVVKRRDVPLTFGMLFYVLPRSPITPYALASGGVNFAIADLGFATDNAEQLVGSLGGGVELRLGRRFALNGDIRYTWRKRLDRPTPALSATQSYEGQTVAPVSDDRLAELRLLGTVFF